MKFTLLISVDVLGQYSLDKTCPYD